MITSPLKRAIYSFEKTIEQRDSYLQAYKESDDEFGLVIDSVNNFIKFTHKFNGVLEEQRNVSNAVEQRALFTKTRLNKQAIKSEHVCAATVQLHAAAC
jgi:methyl-accepting chemotaxis protein